MAADLLLHARGRRQVRLARGAAGTLGEWALTGSFHAAVQDFRIGLPGMLLQIFGGWAFINFIIRK